MDVHVRGRHNARVCDGAVLSSCAPRKTACVRRTTRSCLIARLALGYAVFTQDEDFLAEAARRQRAGEPFAGVVYAEQLGVPIGRCIDDLELLAKVYDPPDMMNQVVYLPI